MVYHNSHYQYCNMLLQINHSQRDPYFKPAQTHHGGFLNMNEVMGDSQQSSPWLLLTDTKS